MTTDLSTTYLGLKLSNPVVVAACPLVSELDVLRRIQDYGAGAAVLPSLFEEQIDEKPPPTLSGTTRAEALMYESAAYYHELKEYNRGPEAYLEYLASAKRAVDIPLIGSLNATGKGPWIRYARRIEEAGADALELNAFFPVADFDTTGHQLEARYVDMVAAVREQISIPLAVKLGPYFTAIGNLTRQLVDAGADGLVLFNRFLQPEIDLDRVRVVPRLTLSAPEEMRETLRVIGLLHGRLNASLAATTGIHFADDAVRCLLAGADVVMVASTLYRHGVEVLRPLVEGIAYWLGANDYPTLDQARGILSQKNCPDPAAFARANYTKAISSYASDSAWTGQRN